MTGGLPLVITIALKGELTISFLTVKTTAFLTIKKACLTIKHAFEFDVYDTNKNRFAIFLGGPISIWGRDVLGNGRGTW